MKYPCQDYMLNNVKTVLAENRFGHRNTVTCKLCRWTTFIDTSVCGEKLKEELETEAEKRICKEKCKYYV